MYYYIICKFGCSSWSVRVVEDSFYSTLNHLEKQHECLSVSEKIDDFCTLYYVEDLLVGMKITGIVRTDNEGVVFNA